MDDDQAGRDKSSDILGKKTAEKAKKEMKSQGKEKPCAGVGSEGRGESCRADKAEGTKEDVNIAKIMRRHN